MPVSLKRSVDLAVKEGKYASVSELLFMIKAASHGSRHRLDLMRHPIQMRTVRHRHPRATVASSDTFIDNTFQCIRWHVCGLRIERPVIFISVSYAKYN